MSEGVCEHDYRYGGVKYQFGPQRSGGNAHNTYYYDWFYCSKCLHRRYVKLDAYSVGYKHKPNNVWFNATPMSEEV